MAKGEVFEFRGVDNLVFAEVLADTKDEFLCGDVMDLSPTAEIGRTTSNSNEAHYYDNQPMVIISSTGADELSLTVAPPDLKTYAALTGQVFDPEIGALAECARTNKYFAIGYRTKGTDGKYRYVWRYKGQFGIPDETSATEDDSTSTNNTQLTWTGVQTVHKFEKYGKSIKALVCDERLDAIDFSTFFDEVKTPDNLDGHGLGNTTPAPEALPVKSTFSAPIAVTLACSAPGAHIFYTTDGTEPAQSVTGTTKEYSAPILVNNKTTIVKAKSVTNGKAFSQTMSKTYVYIK